MTHVIKMIVSERGSQKQPLFWEFDDILGINVYFFMYPYFILDFATLQNHQTQHQG